MKTSLKITLLLLSILFCHINCAIRIQDDSLISLFNQWLKQNPRDYVNDPVQMEIHLQYFILNYYAALARQSQCPACGINTFSDQKPSYQPGTGRLPFDNNSQDGPKLRQQSLKTATLTGVPLSFDWRSYGVVTSVKDQKQCGNCWSFSTTAFFQSQLVRRKLADSTINLAQQFFFQCDTQSQRCNGGYLQSSMDLGLFKNGIPYQAQYPWSPYGRYQTVCKASVVAVIPNSQRVSYYNGLSDNQIISLLLQRPLNIAVAAKNWKFYDPSKQQIFTCPSTYSNYESLDHTALLVGYTQNYWIIKNQWGEDWGINGYIFVARGDSQDCGIGWQVHTLNVQLPIIDPKATSTASNTTSNNSSTTTNSTNNKTNTNNAATNSTATNQTNNNPNVVPETPLAFICLLQNCKQCYYQLNECKLCKEGYQLNIVSKQCIQQIIPNCLQVSAWAASYKCTKCKQNFNLTQGACATPGFNPPPIQINQVVIVDPYANIPASYYTTNTKCQLQFCSNCFNNGRDCLQCITGYGLNQRNGICELSPIENCNLFYSVNTVSNCFECHKGYKLQGNFACVKI